MSIKMWYNQLEANMNRAGEWECEVRDLTEGLICIAYGNSSGEAELRAALICADHNPEDKNAK